MCTLMGQNGLIYKPYKQISYCFFLNQDLPKYPQFCLLINKTHPIKHIPKNDAIHPPLEYEKISAKNITKVQLDSVMIFFSFKPVRKIPNRSGRVISM